MSDENRFLEVLLSKVSNIEVKITSLDEKVDRFVSKVDVNQAHTSDLSKNFDKFIERTDKRIDIIYNDIKELERNKFSKKDLYYWGALILTLTTVFSFLVKVY